MAQLGSVLGSETHGVPLQHEVLSPKSYIPFPKEVFLLGLKKKKVHFSALSSYTKTSIILCLKAPLVFKSFLMILQVTNPHRPTLSPRAGL